MLTQYSVISSYLNPTARKLKDTNLLAQTQILPSSKFSAFYSTKAPSRPFRKRNNKRAKTNNKPILDEARFQQTISQLPSRFINEELCKIITLEDDPLVCLELFNWASQQHRCRHDASTYHVTIKKLRFAKMYQEMDDVVNQLLAVPQIGNEALYNSIMISTFGVPRFVVSGFRGFAFLSFGYGFGVWSFGNSGSGFHDSRFGFRGAGVSGFVIAGSGFRDWVFRGSGLRVCC